MLLQLIIAVILGIVTMWVADSVLPQRQGSHALAALIGLLVGVAFYVGLVHF